MCFSPEVSFAAGGALLVAGLVLIRKFYRSNKILMALIPLFFGIQQIAEGFVWIGLMSGTYPSIATLTAQYTFLFFADMFWPVWMPLSLAFAENIRWRKRIMGILMIIGLSFFYIEGYSFITEGNVRAHIVEHSISYGVSPIYDRIVYAIVTLTPFYFSSIPKLWILGIANTLAFIIADISYNYAFASVWCAFSALLTIGLFILLKVEYPKVGEKK